MLPYILVPSIKLGPVAIHPFGILVAMGVVVGIALATRRARHVGVHINDLRSVIAWILVLGFVGAHVLDSVFYRPHDVLERPWELLTLWTGLSSFGGFVGAAVGALAWRHFELRESVPLGGRLALRLPVRRAKPMRLMPFADVILSVFPVAWVFGRAGCAVVHDHPGARTTADAWLSVAYGPGPSVDYGLFKLRYGNLPSYDLGLLEMLFAVFLALAFALTWRSQSTRGWYIAVASLAYAPVRFFLDFLRLTDPEGGDLRYGHLTPAQWACIVLFAFGGWQLLRLARSSKASTEPDDLRDSATST